MRNCIVRIIISIGLTCHVSSFADRGRPPKGQSVSRSFHVSEIRPSTASFPKSSSQQVLSVPLCGELKKSPLLFAQASTNNEGTSFTATSYSLVWSPGFAKNFGFATLVLVALQMLQLDGRLRALVWTGWKNNVSGHLENVFPNVLLPLLSSSCCLLQLIINALVGTGGCAGFNTFLGPIRPYFLSLFIYLNLFSSSGLLHKSTRYAIAFLPELVHFWNKSVYSKWRRRQILQQQNKGLTSINATVEIDIPTMGCVACINKIESSLRNCAPSQIIDASTWLEQDRPKGGRAKIRVASDSDKELESLTKLIVETIDAAGFGGSVVAKVEIDKNA